jgi:Short C-terminal domain
VIQSVTSRGGNATAVQQQSAADELVKLADLVEKGYLTRDEYEAKKQQLLVTESPITSPSTNSIRATVAAVNTEKNEPHQKSVPKKRNPVLVGCLIIAAALVVLIFVLGQIGSNLVAEPANAGENWEVVGGLDDRENIKFVAVDKTGLGGDFYNLAIQQLCPLDECAYVGFFTPGDKIPPSTSRREFFENGGWKDYRPAAVYVANEFTKWDCEKAGYANAPTGSLCNKAK